MKNLNESRLDNADIVSDAVYTIGDFDEVILSTSVTESGRLAHNGILHSR